MRNEFDFLEPDDGQKARMLEKIKAHDKKNVINLGWLKCAVPIAAAAVLAIVFLPSFIAKPAESESEILVAQADYDAAVQAFAGDSIVSDEESDIVYITIQLFDGSKRVYELDNSEYVLTDAVGSQIGKVVSSDDDIYIGKRVYEFLYSFEDFAAAVEYNGKYRLIRDFYSFITE